MSEWKDGRVGQQVQSRPVPVVTSGSCVPAGCRPRLRSTGTSSASRWETNRWRLCRGSETFWGRSWSSRASTRWTKHTETHRNTQNKAGLHHWRWRPRTFTQLTVHVFSDWHGARSVPVYCSCIKAYCSRISVCFQAYVVLGQFLLLKKDTEMFTEWLKDASGANSRQAGSCTQCLREWCDAFLWDSASSRSSPARSLPASEAPVRADDCWAVKCFQTNLRLLPAGRLWCHSDVTVTWQVLFTCFRSLLQHE